MRWAAALALLAMGSERPPPTPSAADYAADARDLAGIVVANYGYPEHWPGGVLPSSRRLDAERDAVRDRDALLRYAEDVMTSLADHHAITDASFKDDWALAPSRSDLWIEDGRITAVRDGGPAAGAGVTAGDRLVAIGGQPLAGAVAAFWARLGLAVTPERRDYAARVLAAGRRDRARVLTIARGTAERTVTLPNLYAVDVDRPPLSGAGSTIRFNDSLGERETIGAFDRAMAALSPDADVTLDLTDTPSGGNTSVARAVMGWFVDRPTPYQLHELPAEERETGIPRRWLEEVVPRVGKHHPGPASVRVGRWTGSMGEGLAIGFAAIGARVCGGPMAVLKGAVYDEALPRTGLVVKFPVERLYTVDGAPRETWAPRCRT